MRVRALRWGGVAATAALVLAPVGLVVYQSFLSEPFFNPAAHFDFGAFDYVLSDGDFWKALLNTALVAAAMAIIAVPIGGALAFVMARTDMPGRRWLETLMLVPVFLS